MSWCCVGMSDAWLSFSVCPWNDDVIKVLKFPGFSFPFTGARPERAVADSKLPRVCLGPAAAYAPGAWRLGK